MKLKQNELGQVVVDVSLASSKGRAQRLPGSLYDILRSEPGINDEPQYSDDVEDSEHKQQDAVLRKTLRFCMKSQELGLSDIANSIDISKNKIINFLKNKTKLRKLL